MYEPETQAEIPSIRAYPTRGRIRKDIGRCILTDSHLCGAEGEPGAHDFEYRVSGRPRAASRQAGLNSAADTSIDSEARTNWTVNPVTTFQVWWVAFFQCRCLEEGAHADLCIRTDRRNILHRDYGRLRSQQYYPGGIRTQRRGRDRRAASRIACRPQQRQIASLGVAGDSAV